MCQVTLPFHISTFPHLAFAALGDDVENLSPEEMQRKIEELESAIASAEKEQGGEEMEDSGEGHADDLDPV